MRDPSQLGKTLVETMGPVVVINLSHRTDRLREVTDELAKIGLHFDGQKVRRFDAVKPDRPAGFATIGARGCFLSHLGVLELAVEQGWPGVTIVEDDMDFAGDLYRRLPVVLEQLGAVNWGFFHGGTNHAVAGTSIGVDAGLLSVDPRTGIGLTHFIAMHGPVVAMARDYLRAILTREPGDPAGGPMDVDGAYCHFRADHPDVLTVIAMPPLAVQRPSFADVRERKWFDRVGILAPVLKMVRRIKRAVRRRA